MCISRIGLESRWLALGACILAVAALPGCSKQRAEQYSLEGDVYLKQGKYAEAENVYRKSAEANPASAAIRVKIGHCLFLRNQSEAAIQELKEAITLEPSNESAYVELTEILYRNNRLDESIAVAKQFETANPEKGGLLHASCLLRAGQSKESVALLTSLRDRFSSSVGVRVSPHLRTRVSG